jgi:PAS domain S-box-containing protein
MTMVLLLMALAVTLLWKQHRQMIAGSINSRVKEAGRGFQLNLDKQVNGLSMSLRLIAADATVQKALRRGDPNGFLLKSLHEAVWKPVFTTLKQEHGLTYFCLLSAGRDCLLRVHEPESSGVKVDFYTVLEAERTGKNVSGLELSPDGELVLRVVQPIFDGEGLAGYAVLGKGITDILQVLHEPTGLELAVIIKKNHVDYQKWLKINPHDNAVADWERLPENLVIYDSRGRLPEPFLEWLLLVSNSSSGEEKNQEIFYGGKKWRASLKSLSDAAGEEVGSLLIICDISPERASFARLLTVGGLACAVLLIFLLGFIYILLRRTDEGIAVQQGQLRKSEEIHRAMVEGLPDIIVRFDKQCRYLFVSANINEMLDRQTGVFIGKTPRELALPAELCLFIEAAVCKVFETSAIFEAEFTMQTKDGLSFFNWRFVPEFDEHRETCSVLAISRDISSYRRTEQEYKTLFCEMLDGFTLHELICDDNGQPVDYRFLAVNPSFERMTGLKSADIIGKTVREVMPKTALEQIQAYGRVALSGKPAFFENYYQSSGSYFDIKVFRPAINQFACIFTDITERKKAEEKLAHSYELMRYIIEHTSSSIAIHDCELRYIYVSQRYLKEFDIGERNIIGLSVQEVFPGIPQKWLDIYRQALNGAVVSAEDDIYERGDGTKDWIRWECRPWHESDGKTGGIIVYTEFTTERKSLEEQLLQSQKMESVGRLAGGIAHDFNNMLAVILGYTEISLGLAKENQKLLFNIQSIRKAAVRSKDLTRQLLAYARKQTVVPKLLSMNDTVEGMLKMLRRLIGEDIDLSWQPGAGVLPVMMDPSQMDQVLANLCVNARDAIGGVGRIVIETKSVIRDENYCQAHAGFTPGAYVLLAVSDNGCGMERKLVEKIFDPFFTTKKTGEGTGLGLSTVYGIIRQNNGFVNVYSEPGHGTTFKLYLPLADEGELASQEEDSRPMVRGNETILLVEDEPDILNMAFIMLKSLGYGVLPASTPEKAIMMSEKYGGEIHLLITDVIMPSMNGRELSEKLCSDRPGLKVLFMSGYTANVIAHHGVLDPNVNFVAKPFSQKELALKIREALKDVSGGTVIEPEES